MNSSFRAIAFIQDKGGVGKTSLATNLALGLQEAGKKVSVLDLDPNESITERLSRRMENGKDAPMVQRMGPTSQKLLDQGNFKIEQYVNERKGVDEFLIIDTPGQTDGATMEICLSDDLTDIVIPTKANFDELNVFINTLAVIDKKVIPNNKNIRVHLMQVRVQPNSLKREVSEFNTAIEELRSSGMFDHWDSHFNVLDSFTTSRKSYSEHNDLGLYSIDYRNPQSKRPDAPAITEFKRLYETIIGERFRKGGE